MSIWKIGSRWSSHGSADKSVLDIFRKYQIVFAGKDTEAILKNVKVDDYIAISDGLKIVAISKVRELPKKITDFTISDNDKYQFHYEDWVVGIKVHTVDLDQKDYVRCKMGTFHRQLQQSEKLKSYYDNENKNFSIEAKTYKIQGKEGENNFLNGVVKYKIPIYQRPYSWEKSNIEKFLKDITTSYCDENGNITKEPIFFGNMQFSIKKYYDRDGYKFEQDVIDGQQRLSTILTFLKVLKLKFSEYEQLQNIRLDWLETHVNNFTQNTYLSEFLQIQNLDSLKEDTTNKYVQNAYYIYSLFEDFLNESFPQDGKNTFSIEDFLFGHIFENLYFVVIETKAGLSKTLQIFDTINTTGLDLKGTDVFKIRMFEYLKDIQNKDDKIFEEINKLYEEVDLINKEKPTTSMEEILSVYQIYLIGKHQLSNALYSLNVNTFFERLFDVVLNINKHQNFDLPKEFILSLEKIEKIINVRKQFEKDRVDFLPILDCEYTLISKSRYGRYWKWILIFYIQYSNEENFNGIRNLFISKLSKYVNFQSVRFQKVVNEAHNVLWKVNAEMLNKHSCEYVIKNIVVNKEILKTILSREIAGNHKWKYIICRTSAMLEDKDNSELKKLIFNTKIDIEHIQSFKDQNDYQKVREVWGSELNSIGNLIILEESLNRKIKNYNHKKDEYYTQSQFQIVKNFRNEKFIPEEWTKDRAEKRKEKEVSKLMEYYLS